MANSNVGVKSSVDRYECNKCSRKFADMPGFEGRRYSEDVILPSIRLVTRNMLPNATAATT